MTPARMTQLRSVNGRTTWIIRECRPEHACRVNRLQQMTTSSRARVRVLREANKLAVAIKETSGRGLTLLGRRSELEQRCVRGHNCGW